MRNTLMIMVSKRVAWERIMREELSFIISIIHFNIYSVNNSSQSVVNNMYLIVTVGLIIREHCVSFAITVPIGGL